MAGQPGCTSIQGAYASTALWCTFPVVLISFIFSYPLKEEGELGMRPRRNKAGGGFERASKLCCSFQLLEAVYHANFGIHSVHRQWSQDAHDTNTGIKFIFAISLEWVLWQPLLKRAGEEFASFSRYSVVGFREGQKSENFSHKLAPRVPRKSLDAILWEGDKA